ncbi:MAG: ABC transporter substrate-binding protein, partial [Bradyrhizobium sp.]
MRRREFLLAAAMLTPAIRHAMAQQPAKTKRLALVASTTKTSDMKPGGDPAYDVFFEEMKRLGYVEGKNLTVERYSADGQRERYGDLAREIAATNPDVIGAGGSPLTGSLKRATTTIPIVAVTGDPVRFGLISSLARPGGNITGVSVDAGLEIWSKRLALLVEAVPKLTNVVFLATESAWENPGGKGMREAAPKLGISLTLARLNSPVNEAEYRRIFDTIALDQSSGIVISEDNENFGYRPLLVQLALQKGLPAMYSYRDQAVAGGLMSYSFDIKAAVRRSVSQIVE